IAGAPIASVTPAAHISAPAVATVTPRSSAMWCRMPIGSMKPVPIIRLPSRSAHRARPGDGAGAAVTVAEATSLMQAPGSRASSAAGTDRVKPAGGGSPIPPRRGARRPTDRGAVARLALECAMGNYTAEVLWLRGDQDFLDNRYSRRHLLRFDGGAEVAGSSSPHVVPVPGSDPSAVDPEE